MAFKISGLSIDDILELSPDILNSLNRQDLAKLTSRLASAGNKRIKRLEESEIGETSPALQGLKGKKFSVKNKNVNELRNEFKRVKTFLSAKTSSITGWKKTRLETTKRSGFGTDTNSAKKFWELYNTFEKNNKGLVKSLGSDRVQQAIKQEMLMGETIDDEYEFFKKMQENLENEYYIKELEFIEDEDEEEYESDEI